MNARTMNARPMLRAAILAACGLGMGALPAAAQGPGPGGGPMVDPGVDGPGVSLGMSPGMGMCPGGRMIEWLDENGDGKITIEEFQAGHDERFAAMDADSDGKITPDEFQSPPKPPKTSRMQRMFQRLDSNDDGVIIREELDQRGDVRFERFDVNGDKVITIEEVQQAWSTCGPRGKTPGVAPTLTGPREPRQ